MKPAPTIGLRHVALNVVHLEACVKFYTELLGMQIEWQPDNDNFYLTSGFDNLALHRAPSDFQREKYQALDHMGFVLNTAEDVDTWFNYLSTYHVLIKASPKTHRDGTRSFYCADPEGNIVQMIYIPSIVNKTK